MLADRKNVYIHIIHIIHNQILWINSAYFFLKLGCGTLLPDRKGEIFMSFTYHFQVDATLVSNEFIDRYLAEANGEYVKVYLYLLRHKDEPVSLERIADGLNHTEADIRRASCFTGRSWAVLSTGTAFWHAQPAMRG